MAETNQQGNPPSSFWTADHDFMNSQPEPLITPHPEVFCGGHGSSFLFGADRPPCAPCMPDDFNLRSSGPDVPTQRSQIHDDLWMEDYGGRGQVDFSGWTGRAGWVGGVVRRVNDEQTQRAQTNFGSPFKVDSKFRRSPILQQPAGRFLSTYPTVQRPDSHHASSGLSHALPWGRDQTSNLSSTGTTVSAHYGSRCWTGQERKRSSQVAGVCRAGES